MILRWAALCIVASNVFAQQQCKDSSQVAACIADLPTCATSTQKAACIKQLQVATAACRKGACAAGRQCCGTRCCGVNETCTNGTCGCTGDGLTSCNGKCVDIQTDPKNCGGCGQACPSERYCAKQDGKPSVCMCWPNYASCGNECRALSLPNPIERRTPPPLDAGRYGVVTVKQISPTITDYIIDQPDPRMPMTPVPSVRPHPGDLVTLHAGGCVQHGGSGATWARYVDPILPSFNGIALSSDDSLWSGMVILPGVNPGQAKRIGLYVNRPTFIPPLAGDNALQLGFKDTGPGDYSDNGYYAPDNGWQNQCQGFERAWVRVRIESGCSSQAGPPLDLISADVDANGFLLNPHWRAQDNPLYIKRDEWAPGNWSPYYVDPDKACPYHAGVAPQGTPVFNDYNRCSSQGVDYDWSFWCSGHANWNVATVEGYVEDTEFSGGGLNAQDYDYNFDVDAYRLDMPPPNPLPPWPAAGRYNLRAEFDARETVWQSSSPWWARYQKATEISCAPFTPDCVAQIAAEKYAANTLVKNDYVVMTGLIGLDTEHTLGTEMHPVYLFALRYGISETPVGVTDHWALFARNSGNEGGCGGSQHYLDVTRLWMRLPASRRDAISFTESRNFKINNNAVSASSVQLDKSNGPAGMISFQLGPPEDKTLLVGELDLTWRLRPGAPKRIVAKTATPSPPRPPREEPDLHPGVALLTPAQKAELARSLPQAVVAKAKLTAKRIPYVAPHPRPGAQLTHPRVVPDVDRQAEDRQLNQAVCKMLEKHPRRPAICNGK